MKTELSNRIEITLPDGTDLIFHMRPGSSPAAFALLDDHAEFLSEVKIRTGVPEEEALQQARALRKIFFPTPEDTNRNMQVVLAGPHERVDWHRDVSWVKSVTVLVDWLTRARVDMRSTMREERDRLSALAARLRADDKEVYDGQ